MVSGQERALRFGFSCWGRRGGGEGFLGSFFAYQTMKPHPAEPEDVPYLAMRMVAIMKKRALKRLPPISAHLLPTLSMNSTHDAWASRARMPLIAWYLSVS